MREADSSALAMDGLSAEAALALWLLEAGEEPDKLLGSGFSVGPAWKLLLHLFVAEEAGRRLSVPQLCTASAMPVTIALRWVRTLEAERRIEIADEASAAGRQFARLTPDTAAQMRQLLRSWMQRLPGAERRTV